jgi:hypothetical protein
MAKGQTVMCAGCGSKYNIYNDIKTAGRGGTLVRICPSCGAVEGHFFKSEFTFTYNAGDGENGVPPRLELEEGYDWGWLTYDRKTPPKEKGDFDQDSDVVSNNLGLED